MKNTLIFSLSLLSLLAAAQAAFAAEFNCEESARQYIVNIASAPYLAHGESISEKSLKLVSRRATGDGAESYEHFVFRRTDSNETYSLKLYVEEIGGVCPLEGFRVSRR